MALIVAWITLLSINPIGSYILRYHESVYFNLQVLYSKYISADLDLDTSPKFQKWLQETTSNKLENDPKNFHFYINPEYVPETTLPIPSYYGQDEKPLTQPFDPRFTISAYLHWIRLNPGQPVPFHWSDWVDLKDLNKYIFLPVSEKPGCRKLYDIAGNEEILKGSISMPIQEYCIDSPLHPLGYKVSKFPFHQTRENMRMLGKSYLYTGFESPKKLIFLTDSKGSYIVDVDHPQRNNYRNSLLTNDMVEQVMLDLNERKFDVLNAYDLLLQERPPPNVDRMMTQSIVNLKPEMFDIDPQQVIAELELTDSRSILDQAYLDSLKASVIDKDPGKYFKEAKIVMSDQSHILGDHHDWRFFNGFTINTDQQVLVLHRLIKNYLQFCRAHGLVTWIAHGSLLSWYWNGMAFPWDADSDAQMPIRDLHKLAREFNQTLVVENVGIEHEGEKTDFNGMGMFFIDVGSSLTHRGRGNGQNNIDARFIDLATGLYVDITGLALSDTNAPARYDYLIDLDKNKKKISEEKKLALVDNSLKQVYNCRNNHFSSLKELSPLVLLGVQNQLGYIPLNFGVLLDHEYRIDSFSRRDFKDYYFVKKFRLWIDKFILKQYIEDPNKFLESHSGVKEKRGIDLSDLEKFEAMSEDDIRNLLKHDWVFREYVLTKNFTLHHEKQMRLLLSSRVSLYRKRLEVFARSKVANRPIWADPFIQHIHVNNIKYEDEVMKVVELSKAYNADGAMQHLNQPPTEEELKQNS